MGCVASVWRGMEVVNGEDSWGGERPASDLSMPVVVAVVMVDGYLTVADICATTINYL